jgi:hypothetical protein
MTIILNLAAKVHYYSDSSAVSVKKKQLLYKFFVSPLPFPEKEDTFVNANAQAVSYSLPETFRKRYEIQSSAHTAAVPPLLLFVPGQEAQACCLQGFAQRAAPGC